MQDPESGGTIVFDTSGPEAAAFARSVARREGGAREPFQAPLDGPHRAVHRQAVPGGADQLLRVRARGRAPALKRAVELAVCAAVAFLAVATVAAGAARAEADAAAPEAADPDAPTVTARVDRAVANVGDPVHLEVVAIAKTAVPVNLPSTVELGPFLAAGSQGERTAAGRRPDAPALHADHRGLRAGREGGAADRGDLPRPARRRADGAHGAGSREDRQPDRQRAGAGVEGDARPRR